MRRFGDAILAGGGLRDTVAVRLQADAEQPANLQLVVNDKDEGLEGSGHVLDGMTAVKSEGRRPKAERRPKTRRPKQAGSRGTRLLLSPLMFPLTLALPLGGGEGIGRQSLPITGHVRLADRLPRILPLPRQGEGGGEGARGCLSAWQ